MRRLHVALTITVALSFGLTSAVYSQGGGRGQEPPRQWWVNKARGGQYGKNKPHIKLPDLKARHKGQANWTEVVVEDENFHATYNQGQPGFKVTPRMRP